MRLLIAIAVMLAAAPVFAQTAAPARNFDGQYIGRRVSQDGKAGCVKREGKVTLNVSGGKVGSPNSDTTAPISDSGNFSLVFDTSISGVGPVTITYVGQIAGDAATGTLRVDPASTAYTGCTYTFSAQKQPVKP